MSIHKPGSTIVICTDGLSNVGLGSLDELWLDEQKEQAQKFYENIGLYAQSQGITISVVSIKGTDCSLENLGKLTELTSGTVDRVEPVEISKNFQSILSLPVIATHVNMIVMLHKGLYVRDEEVDDETKLKSFQVRDIGNVTKESGTSVEYGVRKIYKKEDFNEMKNLPFQLQIRYTRMDGMQCLRVVSKSVPITFDRKVAEDRANIPVLGMHAVQKSARMASRGEYSHARFYNMSNKVMLGRAAKSDEQKVQYDNWQAKGKEFEKELFEVQTREREEGLDDLEEEMEDEEGEEEEQKEEKKKKLEKMRKGKRNDSTSNMLYQMKSFHSSKF